MAVRRGFHRIGLALAVPLLVVAVGALSLSIFQSATLPPEGRDHLIQQTLEIALGCAVAAGVFYLISWAIGWIIAGFKADAS